MGKGSMIAVLGLKTEEITNLISSLKLKSGVCEIANDNADGQVIISGDKNSVQLFSSSLKEKN